MTKRALAALAALTLAMVLAAVFLWTAGGRTDDGYAERGRVLFPDVQAEAAALGEIAVTTGNYTLRLERRDGRWIAPEHAGYPVPDDKVALLISQVAGLRAWEPKTRNPDLYARIGVEDAGPDARSARLGMATAAGATLADVLVGRSAASIGARPSGGVFVRASGDAQSWLADGRVTVPQSVGEWLGTVLHVQAPEVRRIDVLAGERLIASAQKPADGSIYELAYFDPAIVASGATAKDEGFKAMTRGIVSVTAADVVATAAVTFAPDARRVVFETASGLRVVARIGTLDGADWVAFEVDTVDGQAGPAAAAELAARVNGYAFVLDATRLAALTTPMGELVQLPTLQGVPAAP